MNLYTIVNDNVKPILKAAGRRISADPKQWPVEVIKAARSDHPYVDLAGNDVKFEDVDPDEGTARGSISLTPTSALLFTIRPDPVQRKPELDALDVLVDNGQFRAMNENSYREAMANSGQVGKALPRKDSDRYSAPPNQNPYTGDLTGDNSPLEQGNLAQQSPHGRSTMRNASLGLAAGLVRNRDMLGRLQNTMANYPGLSASASILGLKDSIAVAAANMLRDTSSIDDPEACVITRIGGLKFSARFPNGESRVMTATDLQSMLMGSYSQVMRQIMRRGVATVRSFAQLQSVDLDSLSIDLPVIRAPGCYDVNLSGGGDETAGVSSTCERMSSVPMEVVGTLMRLDGEIVEDKMWHAFCPLTGQWVEPTLELRGTLRPPSNMDPASMLRTTVDGGFEDVPSRTCRFWLPLINAVTPMMTMKRQMMLPDGDIIFVADMKGMGEVYWRFVSSFLRPTRMPDSEKRAYGIEGKMAFLVPVDAEIIPMTPEPLTQVERGAALKVAQAGLKEVQVTKWRVGDWTIDGVTGYDDEGAVLKLACLGVPEERLLDMWDNMKAGSQDSVWIPTSRLETKVAQGGAVSLTRAERDIMLELIKSAEEVAEGMDQVATNDPGAIDPTTMDSTLSLQLISSENLYEIAKAAPMFAETEDKVARLVMAARLGKDTLDEDGLSRALRGFSAVNKAIQVLTVEQEQQGFR